MLLCTHLNTTTTTRRSARRRRQTFISLPLVLARAEEAAAAIVSRQQPPPSSSPSAGSVYSGAMGAAERPGVCFRPELAAIFAELSLLGRRLAGKSES